MSSQLCLRWNNHTDSFDKLLNKIYLQDIYSDGTILCRGKFYPVHRFVLSTCSEYFEEMFSQCVHLNNKHPFIIVKDIQPEQMEALLSYMYKGEVNVPQEMLPDLIKAAEAFKIKGLAIDDKPPHKNSRKRTSASSPPSMPKFKMARGKEVTLKNRSVSGIIDTYNSDSNTKDSSRINDNLIQSTSSKYICEETQESIINECNVPLPVIKSEIVDAEELIPIVDNSEVDSSIKQESKDNYIEEESSVEAFDFDGNDNFDANYNFDAGESGQSASWDNVEAIQESDDDSSQRMNNTNSNTSPVGIIQTEKGWKCCECDYISLQKGHAKRHYLRHTGEKPFQCSKCSYSSTEKAHVKRHYIIHTKEKIISL